MPPNPSTGGELALPDANQNFSLIVADAPGSSATGTLRLWGTQLGLAVDASASVSGAGLATEATLLEIKSDLDSVSDTPEYWEDTSFVSGDSPATIDIATALGRTANTGFIANDGAGDFTVSFSADGTNFGDEIRLYGATKDRLNFDRQVVAKVRITWVSDSSYRVTAI